MSEVEQEYQRVVDRLAEELIPLSPSELLMRPEFGSVTRQAGAKEIAVGFWHYEFGTEKHHIVFKTERRIFLFFYRSYISGVVFGTNTRPRLMTLKEAGDYD